MARKTKAQQEMDRQVARALEFRDEVQDALAEPVVGQSSDLMGDADLRAKLGDVGVRALYRALEAVERLTRQYRLTLGYVTSEVETLALELDQGRVYSARPVQSATDVVDVHGQLHAAREALATVAQLFGVHCSVLDTDFDAARRARLLSVNVTGNDAGGWQLVVDGEPYKSEDDPNDGPPTEFTAAWLAWRAASVYVNRL